MVYLIHINENVEIMKLQEHITETDILKQRHKRALYNSDKINHLHISGILRQSIKLGSRTSHSIMLKCTSTYTKICLVTEERCLLITDIQKLANVTNIRNISNLYP